MNYFASISIAFVLLIGLSSCTTEKNSFGVEPYEVTEAGLQWYKIEDLETMENIADRTVLVDMYTSWCGWCKKMDKNTFTDPNVVDYLNEHFVLVKFNAERKDPVTWKGETYETVRMGRRGTNGLAVKLLDGRLGYPSLVYLDGSNLEKITKVPGYKTPDQLLNDLRSVSTPRSS
ncbi:MAG: thioredoxin fold domain-containing protein [Bacteroidota bacterium]